MYGSTVTNCFICTFIGIDSIYHTILFLRASGHFFYFTKKEFLLFSYYLGFGIKCRVCGRGEILKNSTSDIYFGGRCRNESDVGVDEQDCPWKENTFCLKWKLTLDADMKTKVEFMQAFISNKEQLETLPNQTRSIIGKDLEKRE